MNKIKQREKELGEQGEEQARNMLKAFGFTLSRPDWSGYQKSPRLFYGEMIEANEDVEFEIKMKSELFRAPPFDGHGTDRYQIEKRMRRYNKHGIRQFLLCIQTDGTAYGQWLHRLENGPRHDTPNGIRIYPVGEFYAIPNIYG